MTKLYKENDFRDNCGFGLIASIDGKKSRKIITDSINALFSMTHSCLLYTSPSPRDRG